MKCVTCVFLCWNIPTHNATFRFHDRGLKSPTTWTLANYGRRITACSVRKWSKKRIAQLLDELKQQEQLEATISQQETSSERTQQSPPRSDPVYKAIENLRRFLCSKCARVFQLKSALNLHMKLTHNTSEQSPGNRCINTVQRAKLCKYFAHRMKYMHYKKCPLCGLDCGSVIHCRLHMKRNHCKLFRCRGCSQTFSSRRLRKLHRRNSTVCQRNGRKPQHCCSFCERLFLHKRTLLMHMTTCRQPATTNTLINCLPPGIVTSECTVRAWL